MDIAEIKISELKVSEQYSEDKLREIASKIILNLQLVKMGFCDCGNSKGVSFMIRDILRAIENRTNNYDTMDTKKAYELFYKELEKNLGFNKDSIAFEFILHILNSVDVLEHGSSIKGSWLTDYGREVLCAFNIVGDNILDVEYLD